MTIYENFSRRSSLIGVKDKGWAKNAVLLNNTGILEAAKQSRFYSSADLKFVDTSLGGNVCINPPPQFTRYADVKAETLKQQGEGLGRYYSEAIDDHSQIVHFRMGVPIFNSLAGYAFSFFNGSLGRLANTGRWTSELANKAGNIVGFIVSVASFKLQAIGLVANAARYFFSAGSSQFYELKPTMPNYWSAVQLLVNQLAVYMDIVPKLMSGTDEQGKPMADKIRANMSEHNDEYDDKEHEESWISLLQKIDPELFTKQGSIDVYKIATKAQRRAIKQIKLYKEIFNKGDLHPDGIKGVIQQIKQTRNQDRGPAMDFNQYMNFYFSNGANKDATGGGTGQLKEAYTDLKNTYVFDSMQKIADENSKEDSFGKFFEAEANDGSAFVSFRVNYTGQASESFSNSLGESEIASKINGIAATGRNVMFSLAKGDLGPVVGELAKFLGGVVQGATDGMGLGGITSILTGSANAVIPKQWKSSSSSLNKSSYSIRLDSPYNNPLCYLMYVMVPLCMLIAMTLPISTGNQSYTSPFMLEYYDRGRGQTRLGMISSLSISRGVSNQGFNYLHRPLGIDVSFSIEDAHDILHMPITMNTGLAEGLAAGAFGVLFGGPKAGAMAFLNHTLAAAGAWDSKSSFADYMAVLSSQDLKDQIYSFARLKLNLTRIWVDVDSMFSMGNIAMSAPFKQAASFASIFTAGTIKN